MRTTALLAVLSVIAGVSAVAGTVRAASPTEISGTVRVKGCRAGGSSLEVGALPMTAVKQLGGSTDDVPQSQLPVQRSAAQAAAAPGVFTYKLMGLTEGLPYLVAARFTSRHCRVRDGTGASQVAFPGSLVDLVVRGLPATLDVHKCPQPGGDACTTYEEDWRHTSYISPTAVGGAVRTFRSFAFSTAATTARYEVTRSPAGDACAQAVGAVDRKTTAYSVAQPADNGPEGSTRHVQFTIDFTAIIAKDLALQAVASDLATGAPVDLSDQAALAGQAIGGALGLKAPLARVERQLDQADAEVSEAKEDVTKTVDQTFEETDTYFVRVVPLDSSGNCVGSASNTVAVRLEELEPVSVPGPSVVKADFGGHGPFSLGSRDRSITAYEATGLPSLGEAAKWLQVFDGDLPTEGEPFYLVPATTPDGVVSFVRDFAEGLVGAVAAVVDWASTAYEDIKIWVVEQAATIIDKYVPLIDCNDDCEEALMAGLELALASMGIPPSIPNFDQLVEQGEDYLIDKMMDEAGLSAIPGAREEVERFIDEEIIPAAEKLAASKDRGGLGWAKPQSFELPKPSRIALAVTNAGAVRVPANVCARWSAVWVDQCLWLEPIDPGQTKRVVMTLDARELTSEKYALGSQPKFLKETKREGPVGSVFVYKVPKGCGPRDFAGAPVDFELSAWAGYSPGSLSLSTAPAEGFVNCR